MKQLRITILLTILVSMFGVKANAYDIAVANKDGVTIYYNWINDKTEFAVTFKGDSPSSENEYSGDLVIPASVEYEGKTYSVTTIGEDAFYSCSSLTSITIPNSVTSIDLGAFNGCSGLTTVNIPSSVNSIDRAFTYCSGLNLITVESDNSKYDSRDNCNAIIDTETNTLIAGCMNTFIPNSVTSIGVRAFEGCSSLTSITIPNSVTSIDWNSFEDCGLTSITIPSSATYLGGWAFHGCVSLTSAIIGDGVKIIDAGTFGGCSSLKTLIIGKSVDFVGDNALPYGNALTDVYCYAENPPSYERHIGGTNATLHVPASSIEAYRNAAPWSSFKEIISIEETTHTITYMVDGEMYKTYDLLEGTTIIPEPEPTKEGYVFSGWSTIPATMTAEDVTITGSFQLITDEDMITLKESGKGTWCSLYDIDFTDVEGIKAYIASGYDDIDKTIWLTRVFKVPAGTGIMVKGDPGEHKIPHAKVKAVYASFFKGVSGTAISINETDGDNTNYYMAGGQFKRVNGSTTIRPNRAYLQLPTLVFAGTRSIEVVYDDEEDYTTIHSAATTSDQEPGIFYTLQGQRVDNPKKGIYIKNGKKVVIK